MITDYLIVTTVVAGVTLLWRTYKDDHPKFKTFIRALPFVGEPLSCGVCVAYWFSLAAVLIVNPLSIWQPVTYYWPSSIMFLAQLFAGWITVGTGVLLLRSAIIVLLELGATLKHRHQEGHK